MIAQRFLSYFPILYHIGSRKKWQQSQWAGCSPRPVPTTKSELGMLVHKWSLPWEKILHQLPRITVVSAGFLVCRFNLVQHKQFKYRLLKLPSPSMGSWSSCNCTAIASVCLIKASCLCTSSHPRNSCANTFFIVNVKDKSVAPSLIGSSKAALVF